MTKSRYPVTKKAQQFTDMEKRRIHRLFWHYGYEINEIASRYGVSTNAIKRALEELGTPKVENEVKV